MEKWREWLAYLGETFAAEVTDVGFAVGVYSFVLLQ